MLRLMKRQEAWQNVIYAICSIYKKIELCVAWRYEIFSHSSHVASWCTHPVYIRDRNKTKASTNKKAIHSSPKGVSREQTKSKVSLKK